MSDEACGYLIRQFETAWKLASLHLDGLTTEECLWRPAHRGLHVHRSHLDGKWHADWPDYEGYDIGASSIAWLTWHVGLSRSWSRYSPLAQQPGDRYEVMKAVSFGRVVH